MKEQNFNTLTEKIKNDINLLTNKYHTVPTYTNQTRKDIRDTIVGYFKRINAPYINDYSILSDTEDDNFLNIVYTYDMDNKTINNKISIIKVNN